MKQRCRWMDWLSFDCERMYEEQTFFGIRQRQARSCDWEVSRVCWWRPDSQGQWFFFLPMSGPFWYVGWAQYWLWCAFVRTLIPHRDSTHLIGFIRSLFIQLVLDIFTDLLILNWLYGYSILSACCEGRSSRKFIQFTWTSLCAQNWLDLIISSKWRIKNSFRKFHYLFVYTSTRTSPLRDILHHHSFWTWTWTSHHKLRVGKITCIHIHTHAREIQLGSHGQPFTNPYQHFDPLWWPSGGPFSANLFAPSTVILRRCCSSMWFHSWVYILYSRLYPRDYLSSHSPSLRWN